MLLASTKRSLVVAVLISAVVVVGVVLAAYYTEVSGDALRQQVQLIANQDAEQALLAELQASAADTNIVRSDIKQLFLSRGDVIDFLGSIESFNSSEVEVVVDDIDEQEDEASPTLRISLSITGEPAATMLVLESLETLPYASYLESLSISILRDEAGTSRYQVGTTLVMGLQQSI
jgi:hypothetical protein